MKVIKKIIIVLLRSDMSYTKTYITLLLSLFWCHPSIAASTSINPLITYRCDAAADIITITNTLLTPEEAKIYVFSDENGTYNPWDQVKIDPVNKRTSPIHNKKIVKKCMLSSGEYTTIIEPKIFNRDLTSTCGSAISAAVTIEFDGIEILEKRAFEDFCHGNAPIITRITVFGKTTETRLKRIPKYKFY